MITRSDGKQYKDISEAAEDTEIKKGNIKYVLQGKRKTAGGYGWEEQETGESETKEKEFGLVFNDDLIANIAAMLELRGMILTIGLGDIPIIEYTTTTPIKEGWITLKDFSKKHSDKVVRSRFRQLMMGDFIPGSIRFKTGGMWFVKEKEFEKWVKENTKIFRG